MKRMYCMYDTKLQEATGPVIARNDAEAIRAFKTALEGMKYAEDQKLFYVGDFYEDGPYVEGGPTKTYEVNETVKTTAEQRTEPAPKTSWFGKRKGA